MPAQQEAAASHRHGHRPGRLAGARLGDDAELPQGPLLGFTGFTGFSTGSSDKLVYMGSSINSAGTTTASGFNDAAALSSPSNLTAYGYCLKV